MTALKTQIYLMSINHLASSKIYFSKALTEKQTKSLRKAQLNSVLDTSHPQ